MSNYKPDLTWGLSRNGWVLTVVLFIGNVLVSIQNESFGGLGVTLIGCYIVVRFLFWVRNIFKGKAIVDSFEEE